MEAIHMSWNSKRVSKFKTGVDTLEIRHRPSIDCTKRRQMARRGVGRVFIYATH